ncbi:MAG: hypothetical protein ACOYMF_19155, partial [Bacteroidales bacterium]
MNKKLILIAFLLITFIKGYTQTWEKIQYRNKSQESHRIFWNCDDICNLLERRFTICLKVKDDPEKTIF